MLQSLQSLTGAPLVAADGEIGRVYNFLFDDESWIVRYVAVDVRHWLARHDVLIAVSVLAQPDWKARTFRCDLTREQVRQSPNVDSMKPVSRQQEVAMREFYGWPAYWSDRHADTIAIPVRAGRHYPVQAKHDPHLRSTEALTGYKMWADEAAIGDLQDFIVNEDSWHIGYLDVQAGDWLLSRSVLFPTRWVKSISWAERRVDLIHSKTGC